MEDNICTILEFYCFNVIITTKENRDIRDNIELETGVYKNPTDIGLYGIFRLELLEYLCQKMFNIVNIFRLQLINEIYPGNKIYVNIQKMYIICI